ncbi:MAG: DUF2254 domain-containing protein [Terracoccus sp.]
MSDPRRARGEVPTIPTVGPWQRIWRPFWALPAAICAAGIVAGILLPELDRRVSQHLPYLFQGGPDGARGMLSTIATAMISVTGVVFSITLVVLQLASSQFTPRVLGDFLANRITQITLGVFIASFAFALTVLRSVQGSTDAISAFVPQVSVTTAFLLVLASVGCFLAFIHHMTTSIQVSHVISQVGDRTVDLCDRLFPENEQDAGGGAPTWSPSPGMPRSTVTSASRHGSVTQLDYDKLVSVARELEAVVVVDVSVGEFVAEGMRLATVWGRDDLEAHDLDRVGHCIALETERTLGQDAAFGIRQLVDIAERALSPGINDPTTAVQVIDELHRILRVLVQRRPPSAYIRDNRSDEENAKGPGANGSSPSSGDEETEDLVRVVHHPQHVDALVRLATEEVGFYGRESVQVPRRLMAMLEDLLTVTHPTHRVALTDAEDRLRAQVTTSPA